MAGVFIFAEKKEAAWELLRPAREIADAMGVPATLLLAGEKAAAQSCLDRGADRIILLAPLSADQSLDAYLPVLEEAVRAEDPDAFFLAATTQGKELAARLAARLETGLCGNCLAVAVDAASGVLELDRLVYGGAAVQRVRCQSRPVLATLAPRVFEPAPVLKEGRTGAIMERAAPSASPVRVIERRMRENISQSLREAKVVVSVGRGLAKAEDLALIRQLAEALGGEVGCTRPISEELHWLPEDCCIGLSGRQVKPDLFLAVGVSGQVQHLTGVRGAKVVAAVNRDEHAPIFGAADLGIVGDLYGVAPKLLEALKK